MSADQAGKLILVFEEISLNFESGEENSHDAPLSNSEYTALAVTSKRLPHFWLSV